MRKIYIYFIVILVLSSAALAVPAWKAAGSPGAKTTVVQNVTTIIIENATALPKEGVNWEFIGSLIAIIGAVVAVMGWLLSRKERGVTAKYLKEINSTFNDYRSNADKCETALYSLKEKIERDFSHGKINDSAFSILDARLEKYLSDIRKDVVAAGFKLGKNAREEISNMLKDGVISEAEYKKFSKMELEELSAKEKHKLDALMRKWKSKIK